MVTLGRLCEVLERLAPLELSEAWDNTGLLMGDRASQIQRVMTCLTLTPESVQEAIEQGAELVIAHHPLPFKPVSRITTDSYVGGMLWRLAKSGIAIYSPHTAWDSAEFGINARLAQILSLKNCQPLIPADPVRWPGVGSGRMGELPQPTSLSEVSHQLSQALSGYRPRAVDAPKPAARGDLPATESDASGKKLPLLPSRTLRSVAIACGSGGSLLGAAAAKGCELLVTGEATFHLCLEAQASGISLLMVGHFASERFAMEQMATELSNQFPMLLVWASRIERDPVRNLSH